jgi:hypothetical protein
MRLAEEEAVLISSENAGMCLLISDMRNSNAELMQLITADADSPTSPMATIGLLFLR